MKAGQRSPIGLNIPARDSSEVANAPFPRFSLDGAAHIMKKTKPVSAAELDHLHAQFLRQLYAELWRRNSSTHSVDDGSSDARRPDPHDGFDPTTLDLNAIHDLITRLEDARERWREEAEAAGGSRPRTAQAV